MWVKHFGVAVLVCLTAVVARGQDDDEPPPAAGPVAIPYAVRAGETTALTFYGVAGKPLGVWTSLKRVEVGELLQDGKKVRCTMTVPAGTAVGVAAMRLMTSSGVSPVQLFMVDDLPTVAKRGKNHSVAEAQEIVPPCAVDGTADRLAADYYRLTLAKGQRVSVEVVANRIGSRMDPVVRLLDASGVKEIAYSDDGAGGGADARFSIVVPADGTYVLEVRDDSYEGGGDYRYRLRVGDFPVGVAAFPPVWKRGATTRVSVEGPAVEGVGAREVTYPEAGRGSVSFTFPGGKSSGFVSIFGSETDEVVVPKKLLTKEAARRVVLPVALAGRFTKPGSKDWYSVDAKKGEKLVFRIKTRMLGSPCDPLVRVMKDDGAVVAQLKPTSVVVADERKGPPPPPATEDERFEAVAPADGVYRFSIEDLNRGGGPGMVYHMTVERGRATFELLVDVDKVEAEKGVAKVKVKAVRAGYAGEIKLGVEGAEGTGSILAGKTDGEVEIKLAEGTKTGIVVVKVVGSGGEDARVVASTRGAVRRQFPRMVPAPVELEGVVAVGVK